MSIRKIIREYLEKVVNQVVNDIDMADLDEFKLVSKKIDDNGNYTWKYSINEKNYTINLIIAKTKKDKWFYKIFVYWGAISKKLTSGKGKDFELKFGPFENFDEMKKNLLQSVKNHLLFSFTNYHDNNKIQLDDEVFKIIGDIKKYENEISSVGGEYFKDLKKITPILLKSKEEVKKFLDKEYPDEEDKQFLILTLQKMYKINMHKQIDSIKSLF